MRVVRWFILGSHAALKETTISMSSMDVARSVDVQCLEWGRLIALLLGPEHFRVQAVASNHGALARRDFCWERLVLPAPYLFSNVAERLGRRSSGQPSVIRPAVGLAAECHGVEGVRIDFSDCEVSAAAGRSVGQRRRSVCSEKATGPSSEDRSLPPYRKGRYACDCHAVTRSVISSFGDNW